jgi:hypothetical protein
MRRQATLHRALLALLLSAVLVLLLGAAPQHGDAAAPAPLTWSPPSCGDPTHSCRDVQLLNTGSHQILTLSGAVDYRVHLPVDESLEGGITIHGGHNVQIIGGQIDLTTPCDDSSSACRGILISRDTPGEVYIEGVYIRNPDSGHSRYTSDGIAVDDAAASNATDITVQNVRIEGIDGCDPSGNPAAHADVFQPWAVADAHIRLDRVTGTTDCQGLQLDPDIAWSRDGRTAALQDIRNVNIDVLANPHTGNVNRYAVWLTYSDDSCVAAPTTLQNVYVREPDATLARASVWPDADRPPGCPSVWLPDVGQVSFPHVLSPLGIDTPDIRSSAVAGAITAGLPPGGDFVPAGSVGIGYASPGPG